LPEIGTHGEALSWWPDSWIWTASSRRLRHRRRGITSSYILTSVNFKFSIALTFQLLLC